MSEVDWDKISKLAKDWSQITDDEVDITINLLNNIEDAEQITDVEKLQQALQVSLVVVTLKDEENKQNLKENNDFKEKNKRLEELKIELERENAELQRGAGNIDIVREKRNWDMEKEQLLDEINNLKKDYNQAKVDKDSNASQINELMNEVERLRDENKKFAENVDFLRDRNNQLKSQKDTSQDVKKSELAYVRSELRQKKIDLDNAQEQMMNLHQEIDTLKESLGEATNEIERLTVEFQRMKSSYGNNDFDLQNKETQIITLQTQLEHLQDQLSDKNDADDQIMNHLNAEVEKWSKALKEKESEIIKVYQENDRLRKDLQASNINAEKANIQALIKLVKEREDEVTQLSKNLQEATKNIDENAEIITNLKRDLDKTGGGTSGHQMRRIKELREMLDDKNSLIEKLKTNLSQIESQTESTQEELHEALERNRMYERGEYGLSDAVAEIKVAKRELSEKDRQIENIYGEINKTSLAMEELRLENGHLRTKLGIPLSEVLDVDGYKRQKAAEEEQEKATNLVLQKEIENLEDERLMLKKKVRVLARQAGLRAGSAGIHVDDVMDELKTIEIEEGLTKTDNQTLLLATGRMDPSRLPVHSSERIWKIKEKETTKELNRLIKDLESKEIENSKLSIQNQEIQKENDNLLMALTQIKTKLQQPISTKPSVSSKGDKIQSSTINVLECPALDQVLSAMETKKLVGNYDSSLYMKSKMDNLEGRNEELRSELRHMRVEHEEMRLKLERALEQRSRYENELGVLSGLGFMDNGDSVDGVRTSYFGGQLTGIDENNAKTNTTPANVNQTIAALNQHLIIVLQEKSVQEKSLQTAHNSLEQLQRKFAVIRHRQGLLYRQFAEEKQKWKMKQKQLEDKMKEVQLKESEDEVKLKQYSRLQTLLDKVEKGGSRDSVSDEILEMGRELTMLKVNEHALTSQITSLHQVEHALTRENNGLKNDSIQMERVVMEKLGYYRRLRESNAFKMKLLQKQLDESVSRKELDKVQHRLDDITQKYHNILERQNELVLTGRSMGQLESEVGRMREDHNKLKRALEGEKQRRMVVEAALEEMEAVGFTGTTTHSELSSSKKSSKKTKDSHSPKSILSDGHLLSLTKKMATLEMKELNERERADHYMRQYDNLKTNFDLTESRNKDLEEKITALTQNNLEQQKIERELRNELEDSIGQESYSNLKTKMLELEQHEMQLRHESERLRETADIATAQTALLLEREMNRQKEVGLRGVVTQDSGNNQESGAEIGKMQRLLLQLQMSEAAALRKLGEAHKREKQLEVRLRREEMRGDDGNDQMFQFKSQAKIRADRLRETINSLRSQYAGSISLTKQEKFSKGLLRLTEEKASLDKSLQDTLQHKYELETELESLRIIENGKIELAEALKDKSNEKNILIGWHSKMEKLRLDELKQRRQADVYSHQIEHLESLVRFQETQMNQLEQELVRSSREIDEKEVNWEERERIQETHINQLEMGQGAVIDMAGTIHQVMGVNIEETNEDVIIGGILKEGEPLPAQLEQAVSTLRKYVKILITKENTIKAIEKTKRDKDKRIRELEGEKLQLEKLVTEMRLRLPATENRFKELSQLFQQSESRVMMQSGDMQQDTGAHDEAIRKMQQVVTSLQNRISSKDECIAKLESLLKESRTDMLTLNERHQEELESLRSLLKSAHASKSQQFNVNSMHSNDNAGPTKTEMANLLTKNRELEDLLNITKLEATNEKMKTTEMNRQMERLKQEIESIRKAQIPLEHAQQETNKLYDKVKEKDAHIEYLEGKVQNQAPKDNSEMLQDLKRLNKKMSEKDELIGQLRRLVQDLKEQLMKMQHTSSSNIGITPSPVIDNHSKQLKRELEETKDQLLEYQKQLRQMRNEKENVQIEADRIRLEVSEKENGIRRLKADKMELETDLEDAKKQLNRLKNMRSVSTDRSKQEMDELRLKVHLLEEEFNNLKHENQELRSKHKTTAWENGKDKLSELNKTKEKLNKQEVDLNQLKKQFDTLSRAYDRTKTENDVLKGRLSEKWGPGAIIDLPADEMIDEQRIAPSFAGKVSSSPEKRNEVSRNSMRTFNPTNRSMDIPESHGATLVAFKESEMRNKLLQQQINDLERRLIHNGNSSEIQLEKERAMQKEITRLNGDNIKLRFELEGTRKEIPRLKEKNADLQKFIEVLKADRDKDETRSNRSFESTTSTISNIKKVGDSGKSAYELEKTISRLKKVLEKTQKENERLKEAPGVIMEDRVQYLHDENSQLKSEISELQQRLGSKLTERYDAKERGVAKLMQEHEKTRKELHREIEDHKVTRKDLHNLTREMQRLERSKMDVENKLALAESRLTNNNRQNSSVGLMSKRSNSMEKDGKNQEIVRLQKLVDYLQNQLEDQSQNSNHSQNRYDNLKRTLATVTKENKELERKLKSVEQQFGISLSLDNGR